MIKSERSVFFTAWVKCLDRTLVCGRLSFLLRNQFSVLFSLYPLVQLILGLSQVDSTTTPHPLTFSPIYDPEPFRLNWMLPAPPLSIAARWPSHPSLSAFVFYYTLSQKSILSTNLTDSLANKYNNKDTQAIFVTHGSRSTIKTSTFARFGLWWYQRRHPQLFL